MDINISKDRGLRMQAPVEEPPKSKFPLGILIAIVVVAILAFLGYQFFMPSLGSGEKTWYAVHLNNGQVYFGQIKNVNSSTITLANTYYLELLESKKPETSSSQNYQIEQNATQQVYNLTRRGGANFMTTDNVLFVNRYAVLFWEKLDANSDMVKTLNKVYVGGK
jgi:hypothetical protein